MVLKNFFGLACGFGLMAATSAFALPKSADLVADMGMGYNIGNTMEAPGNPTIWGNDFPTAEYVKAIKAAGFNSVRIPCAWDSHASNGVINAGWLDSVKTVVDMVVGEGMYAVLNSHWDGGWLEDHVFDGAGYDKNGATTNSAATVAATQEAYWGQIAAKFAEYDEHLIFASANEPGVNDPWMDGGTDNGQWGFDAARMKVLRQYHEACLKAVRNAGGNNATRTVVVQMPRTEIDKYELLASDYPTDPAGEGYTMAEAHYYPYQFSLMTEDATWGKCFYYFDGMGSTTDTPHNMGSDAATLGTKLYTEAQFSKLETAFGSKGIPVIIGEFGAVKRLEEITGDNLGLHLKGRAAWYGSVAKSAKAHNIVTFAWDTGDEGNGNMTIIRRQTKKYGGKVGDIVDIETLNALRAEYSLAALEGHSVIDSLVAASKDDSNKMLSITYTTTGRTDSSEVGTMRIDLGGKNWSKYIGIQFDAEIDIANGGPLDGKDYGWESASVFAMTGSSWDWHDYNLEIEAGKTTYKVMFEDMSNDFNASSVNAIGLNIYGTLVTGTVKMDNLMLIKKDGTLEVLNDFNKKTPTLEGIAEGKLVASTFAAPITAIKPAAIAASKMFVNVQQGFVNATFPAQGNVQGKAMIMNTMGQVIASESFVTRSGSNTVQLKANYRGAAMLIIKQGSQVYSQKVLLK